MATSTTQSTRLERHLRFYRNLSAVLGLVVVVLAVTLILGRGQRFGRAIRIDGELICLVRDQKAAEQVHERLLSDGRGDLPGEAALEEQWQDASWPVEDNDVRVLMQLHPEKLSEIFESDPVSLIIGILKSRHGQIDSDQLEHLLSPRYISAAGWKQWWTKAKNALKRCPYVFVEGRNPVILTYHEKGKSLEDEIEPQWAQAQTPAQRIAVIDTYFREAKVRKIEVKPTMIERIHSDLLDRVKSEIESLVEEIQKTVVEVPFK